MIKIYILISLLIFSAQYSESIGCNQDWECGNTPYTLCKKNHSLPHHRLDISNDRLYFTIKYSDENEKRIVSIPVGGSNGFDVISHVTIYGQDTYQLLTGLSQFIGPKSNDFIIYGGRRIIGTQNYVFYNNNTIGIPLASVSDSNYIFDEDNNIQYVCHQYGSIVYKGPIKTDIKTQVLYYGCNEIKSVNNLLYISYQNKIYKGSLNPSSNETLTSSLPVVYSQSDYISSFEITSTHIYILSSNTIHKVPLNNPSQKVLIFSGSNISSFKYYYNYVYFSFNNKIQRVSTLTNNIEILFEFDSPSSNHCICAQGYKSTSKEPKCSKCDSSTNIPSWVNGIPRCLPLDWRAPNNPIVCNYDWQCKSGSCKEKVLSGGTFSCF